ncbi:GNAT family N-acetyltransferase, partial [Vibrio sp. 10N.222.49.C9]
MMNTVLLDKAKHDRNRFNCGSEALNNYLKVMASQQAKKDNTRTFVLEDDNDNSHIIGFYT